MASDNTISAWKGFFTAPEWLWRHTIAAMCIAQLWLNQKYVTQAEYKANNQELSASLTRLSNTLADVRLSLELLKQGTSQITDHETRIRILEQQQRNR